MSRKVCVQTVAMKPEISPVASQQVEEQFKRNVLPFNTKRTLLSGEDSGGFSRRDTMGRSLIKAIYQKMGRPQEIRPTSKGTILGNRQTQELTDKQDHA